MSPRQSCKAYKRSWTWRLPRTGCSPACAATAVAAERYRLKHEHWPKSLDDLVQAGFLKEVPKDPYDGKPLRLKRTATGLIIYSCGRDRVDDGGVLNRANPMAANTDSGF